MQLATGTHWVRKHSKISLQNSEPNQRINTAFKLTMYSRRIRTATT